MPPRGIFHKIQIIQIDVNFHLQKSLEIFDKNAADKIWFKKDMEIKVTPPHVNKD